MAGVVLGGRAINPLAEDAVFPQQQSQQQFPLLKAPGSWVMVRSILGLQLPRCQQMDLTPAEHSVAAIVVHNRTLI